MTDTDNLKDDFNCFKSLMINEFDFNSLKKQLLETSEIDLT